MKKDKHRFCNTNMIVGKEKAIISDTLDNKDVSYDWKYYSERKGWSDETISKMKKFVDEVLELGKSEDWKLDLKCNQRYCAIQTKSMHNICSLRERKWSHSN